MPLFPIFIDLEGKNCVVVGGGRVASRKIAALLKFGACITIISPHITDALKDLHDAGTVFVIERAYREGDLEGADIVIAAASDEEINTKVYKEAANKGIPVNVADRSGRLLKGTFNFPSTVIRDELVIGISTSGGYPALAKKIREKLEDAIPQRYGSMLGVLKELRSCIDTSNINPEIKEDTINDALQRALQFMDEDVPESLTEYIKEIMKKLTRGV